MNKLLKEFKQRYGFLPDEMGIGEKRVVEQQGKGAIHFNDLIGALQEEFLIEAIYEHNLHINFQKSFRLFVDRKVEDPYPKTAIRNY